MNLYIFEFFIEEIYIYVLHLSKYKVNYDKYRLNVSKKEIYKILEIS